MKKIVLMAVVALMSVTVSQAQTKAKVKKAKKAKATIEKVVEAPKVEIPKVTGPGLLFDSETIDYGTVPHNADGKREFTFINNGTEPLIIESATGSCGCTVPTKPEKAIAPGERGVIGVKYATDRVGQFTKNVTIKSNASKDPKVLTIKGNVLPDPTPEAAPVKS